MAIRLAANRLGPLRQRGVVSVMVGVTIMMLLLMLGLVLDLGHLYIVKTELQNAADACALSAARELATINADTATSARTAGKSIGGMNRVNFQSEAVDVQDADIIFSALPDSGFGDAVASDTRYVRCIPHGTNVKSVAMWFMVLAGVESWNMSASAVARLGPSQSHCAIPLAICSEHPENVNWDLKLGTWYRGRFAAGKGVTGAYDWIEFGHAGARAAGDLLAGDGQCDLTAFDTVDAKPGIAQGIVSGWNTRFGLYSGTYKDIQASPPDLTGFPYTWDPATGIGSWAGDPACGTTLVDGVPKPLACKAYDPANKNPNAFLGKREAHAPYDPAAYLDDKGKPVKFPGNPQPSSTAEHSPPPQGFGRDRRIATVPVINCNTWQPNKNDQTVYGWACVLMLAPIPDPGAVVMEFLGSASSAPCATSGIPGGAGGAFVAQLVR